eukprot:248833-Prymnesium_polylepis.1
MLRFSVAVSMCEVTRLLARHCPVASPAPTGSPLLIPYRLRLTGARADTPSPVASAPSRKCV